jgi:rhodanese-related sulfurtransferase
MKNWSAFIILFFSCLSCAAQYQFDNVKFRTVYLEDLCNTLKSNPGFLLLDVRSNGEFNDTSTSNNYNIGHLNNAVNIDVRELPKKLNEIQQYKNRPVFVYCSHSQRSRRASAMLADSGFTHVFNINGGLTNFRNNDYNGICENVFVKSGMPFNFISPKLLAATIEKKNYYIVDLRNDSSYKALSSEIGHNVYGYFSNSVNIPFNSFANHLQSIPKDKPILLVDEGGSESNKAAQELINNGYKNVSVLFEGLDMWVNEVPATSRKGWKSSTDYSLINAYTLSDVLNEHNNAVLLDIRAADEFVNQSKISYKNIGKLKNSINIPYSEFNTSNQLTSINKNTSIIIYSFSTDPETFKAAQFLSSEGYKNIYVLMGGLFNTRWKAANIKGKEYLNALVVNTP